MSKKEYYEEKVWEILNIPYGTFSEKPSIRFCKQDTYGVHFLINNVKMTFPLTSFYNEKFINGVYFFMMFQRRYYVYGSEHPKYKSLLHFCNEDGNILCKRKLRWGEVTAALESIEGNNLKISGFGNSRNFPSYIYNYKDITCKVCLKKLLEENILEIKK